MEYLIDQKIVFNVDTSTLSLTSSSDPAIVLSGSCTRVLLQLVENNGQIVERDSFFSAWQAHLPEISSNSNLNHCISLLRKYFRDYQLADSVLKTVPRQGFIFSAQVERCTSDSEPIVEPRPEPVYPELQHAPKRLSLMNLLSAGLLLVSLAIYAYVAFAGNKTTAVSSQIIINGCRIFTAGDIPASPHDMERIFAAGMNMITRFRLQCSENVNFFYYQQHLEPDLQAMLGREFLARCEGSQRHALTRCVSYSSMKDRRTSHDD